MTTQRYDDAVATKKFRNDLYKRNTDPAELERWKRDDYAKYKELKSGGRANRSPHRVLEEKARAMAIVVACLLGHGIPRRLIAAILLYCD